MSGMRRKFLAGGVLVALALTYMIYSGVTQSAVYFVTPSELLASPLTGKAYRLGGLVGVRIARMGAHLVGPELRPHGRQVNGARAPQGNAA